MPHADVGGLALHYQQQGEGPDLLMIMGLGTDLYAWDQVLPHIEGFRVTRFDNRGAGLSDKPEGDYSMRDFVADTLGLMDALGIERAHLAGISMGGMIAQHLAIAHPERVERLALMVTSAGGPAFVPPAPWVLGAMTNPPTDPTPEALAERHGPVLFSERFRRERPEEVVRVFTRSLERPMPMRCFQSQLAAIMRHDATGGLGGLRMPTLVVSASDDALVPPANSEHLLRALPGAGHHRVEGSGHAITHEAPRELAEVLMRFLEGAPASA